MIRLRPDSEHILDPLDQMDHLTSRITLEVRVMPAISVKPAISLLALFLPIYSDLDPSVSMSR